VPGHRSSIHLEARHATMNGNALSGALNWSRGAYGQGYCSSGTGRIVVSGRRQ